MQADPTRDPVGDQLGDGPGSQEPEQMPGGDARAVGELIPGQALVVSEPQEHPPERAAGRRACVIGRLLPVEGAEQMRAASRAAGRRARRNTGQATGDRASMRQVRAFTSCSSSGTCPSDRRWPNRLRFIGVGVAYGRRPVFSYSASLA